MTDRPVTNDDPTGESRARAGEVPEGTVSFEVTRHHRGARLDHFLQAMLPRMSRRSIKNALASRTWLASGVSPKPSRPVVVGDTVHVLPVRPEGPPPAAPPVLHDGAGFRVVDKPAGLPTVPHARHAGRDVVTVTGFAAAHRLDLFTSGCLLLVKDAPAARHFAAVFQERRARKEYAAVVRGVPNDDELEVDQPIARDESSRVPGRMRVAEPGEADARPATTRVKVVATDGDRSLVRARPESGRRHQVRVHLAAIGHPLVGDLLYGGDERRFIRWQLGQPVDIPDGLEPGRYLLHARTLAFPTPEGESVTVEAPWPDDFPAALTERWC